MGKNREHRDPELTLPQSLRRQVDLAQLDPASSSHDTLTSAPRRRKQPGSATSPVNNNTAAIAPAFSDPSGAKGRGSKKKNKATSRKNIRAQRKMQKKQKKILHMVRLRQRKTQGTGQHNKNNNSNNNNNNNMPPPSSRNLLDDRHDDGNRVKKVRFDIPTPSSTSGEKKTKARKHDTDTILGPMAGTNRHPQGPKKTIDKKTKVAALPSKAKSSKLSQGTKKPKTFRQEFIKAEDIDGLGDILSALNPKYLDADINGDQVSGGDEEDFMQDDHSQLSDDSSVPQKSVSSKKQRKNSCEKYKVPIATSKRKGQNPKKTKTFRQEFMEGDDIDGLGDILSALNPKYLDADINGDHEDPQQTEENDVEEGIDRDDSLHSSEDNSILDDASELSDSSSESKNSDSSKEENRKITHDDSSGIRLNQSAFRVGIQPAINRRLRGLLNRVSDENCQPIAHDVLRLLDSQIPGAENDMPRAMRVELFVNTTYEMLTDDSSANIMNHYIPAHCAIVTYLYKKYSRAIGGRLIEMLVRNAESSLRNQDPKILQISAILCQLFTMNLFHCSLMFDLIRRVVLDDENKVEITELKAEMLLLVIKRAGQAFRDQDPATLGDIVSFIVNAVEEYKKRKSNNTLVSSADAEVNQDRVISNRLKILLDFIFELKNNRVLSSTGKCDHNPFAWLRAEVGEIELLRVKYSDLLDSTFTKGHWWEPKSLLEREKLAEGLRADSDRGKKQRREYNESDFATMASLQRLNTDFRRSIFTLLMSSSDVNDAFQRIQKLDLKQNRDQDVIRIIVHCCGQEKLYNPFYALLGTRLSLWKKSFSTTLQYTFWDQFKLINGSGVNQAMNIRKVSNLGKMLGHLLATRALQLTVFKVIENFVKLSEREAFFYKTALEVCFIGTEPTLLSRDAVEQMFRDLVWIMEKQSSSLESLQLMLSFFIKKQFVTDAEKKSELTKRAKICIKILDSAEL